MAAGRKCVCDELEAPAGRSCWEIEMEIVGVYAAEGIQMTC